MNLDINQILNNPKTKGVVTALPQGLNIAQMGLDRLTTALNYNPYNVSIQKQSFNGKPLMKSGGSLDNNTFDGATHAQGGINVNQDGIPTEINPVAEVEDGEYKYTDPKTKEVYIFSNRLPYKYKK